MKRILYIMLACVLLAGCRSSQHANRKNQPIAPTEGVVPITPKHPSQKQVDAAAFVSRVAKTRINKNSVTASVKVNLKGLGKDLAVSGSLRMKRNEVVRLSLRFMGIEVGLMEFTPSYVLIVDRMKKQYVRAAYTDVSFLKQANIDFAALQALFWNEIFVPGVSNPLHAMCKFQVADHAGHTLLTLTDTPQLTYTFTTSTAQALVEQLLVKGKNAADKAEFRWNYGQFKPFAGRHFPTTMQMQVSGGKTNIELGLQLSDLDNNSDWTTYTNLSSRYKPLNVEEIFKGLKF